MVSALPWRSTHPLPVHTRMERPRRAPSPRAPTSVVPTTQSQALDETWWLPAYEAISKRPMTPRTTGRRGWNTRGTGRTLTWRKSTRMRISAPSA